MSEQDNGAWQAAEAEFEQLYQAVADRIPRDQLLEEIPFEIRALAYAQSTSSAQIAARLGVQPERIERTPWGTLAGFYLVALGDTGIPIQMPH